MNTIKIKTDDNIRLQKIIEKMHSKIKIGYYFQIIIPGKMYKYTVLKHSKRRTTFKQQHIHRNFHSGKYVVLCTGYSRKVIVVWKRTKITSVQNYD